MRAPSPGFLHKDDTTERILNRSCSSQIAALSNIKLAVMLGLEAYQRILVQRRHSHLSDKVSLLHNAAGVYAPLCEEAPQLLDRPCGVVHLLSLFCS